MGVEVCFKDLMFFSVKTLSVNSNGASISFLVLKNAFPVLSHNFLGIGEQLSYYCDCCLVSTFNNLEMLNKYDKNQNKRVYGKI